MELFKDTLCFSQQDDQLFAYVKTEGLCQYVIGSEFNFRSAFEFYKDLIENAKVPYGLDNGNHFTFQNYGTKDSVNGEVSDWMLSTKGIYAMSPYLGTTEIES